MISIKLLHFGQYVQNCPSKYTTLYINKSAKTSLGKDCILLATLPPSGRTLLQQYGVNGRNFNNTWDFLFFFWL